MLSGALPIGMSMTLKPICLICSHLPVSLHITQTVRHTFFAAFAIGKRCLRKDLSSLDRIVMVSNKKFWRMRLQMILLSVEDTSIADLANNEELFLARCLTKRG